jgi:hypothetical protein
MYFTQIHKYDERKAFKEAWKKWIGTSDIQEMIETERIHLTKNGFVGDIEDKMFTSVRYYFRKKTNKNADEQIQQKQRKKYVGFSGKLLTSMDTHIVGQIRDTMVLLHTDISSESNETKKTIFTCDISPDNSYADFCEKYLDLIQHEYKILNSENYSEEDSTIEKCLQEFSKKTKKTYKNRYQTIRKKLTDAFVTTTK